MSVLSAPSFEEILLCNEKINASICQTPLRNYPQIDAFFPKGTRIFFKHENFQISGAFKLRNALAAITDLSDSSQSRGVIAASRGNHGAGLAFAARKHAIPCTIVVPEGNNPDKNALIRSLGAQLHEEGSDYDESVAAAERIKKEQGHTLIHSTNNPGVIKGAASIFIEIMYATSELDEIFVAVGGGSQAAGAILASEGMAKLQGKKTPEVSAVQAAGAQTIWRAWHGKPAEHAEAETIADGLATRSAYPITLDVMKQGLKAFYLLSEEEILGATRTLIESTHTLVEPAGAAAFAGLCQRLKQAPDTLRGKHIAVVISGGNIDQASLQSVLTSPSLL